MRYLGNKTKLSKYIIPHISQHLNGSNKYIEPFAGALGVISNLDYPFRIASDKDPYIISLMKHVAEGWTPPEKLTINEYNDIKNNYLSYPSHLVGFVGYGCSFGGKWFGGLAKGGKTSSGKSRNHVKESSRNLVKLRPKLQGIQFNVSDYRDVEYGKDNVIYADIPYSNSTNYKKYFSHKQFWNWARKESINNYLYISEYSAPEDFICVWEKSHKTGIDHAMSSHKLTVEKLFVHENQYNKNS